MAYKDTKIFHKDFGDGGRKARLEIERIAERKERRFTRGDDTINTPVDTPNLDTSVMECKDCGYFGDEREDFLPATVMGDDGHYDAGRECPVCGSNNCVPFVEEDI